jgi:hypothetical protein
VEEICDFLERDLWPEPPLVFLTMMYDEKMRYEDDKKIRSSIIIKRKL